MVRWIVGQVGLKGVTYLVRKYEGADEGALASPGTGRDAHIWTGAVEVGEGNEDGGRTAAGLCDDFLDPPAEAGLLERDALLDAPHGIERGGYGIDETVNDVIWEDGRRA